METSADFSYEPEAGQGHPGKRQIQHCGALKPNISTLQKSSQDPGIYETLADYDQQDVWACLCLPESIHPRGKSLIKDSWAPVSTNVLGFSFWGVKGCNQGEKDCLRIPYKLSNSQLILTITLIVLIQPLRNFHFSPLPIYKCTQSSIKAQTPHYIKVTKQHENQQTAQVNTSWIVHRLNYAYTNYCLNDIQKQNSNSGYSQAGERGKGQAHSMQFLALNSWWAFLTLMGGCTPGFLLRAFSKVWKCSLTVCQVYLFQLENIFNNALCYNDFMSYWKQINNSMCVTKPVLDCCTEEICI